MYPKTETLFGLSSDGEIERRIETELKKGDAENDIMNDAPGKTPRPQPTMLELQQFLAERLKDKLFKAKEFIVPTVVWADSGNPVLDTEWCAIVEMVEKQLTDGQWFEYEREIRKQSIAVQYTWAKLLIGAPWPIRAKALMTVLGKEKV